MGSRVERLPDPCMLPHGFVHQLVCPESSPNHQMAIRVKEYMYIEYCSYVQSIMSVL